jgi:hypothetical protein
MRKFLFASLSFAMVVGGSVLAVAKDPPLAKKGPFEKLDTNNDGQVSLEEFCVDTKGKALEGKVREKKEEMFKKWDTSGDGQLSAEEFKAKGAKPKQPKQPKAS